MSLAVEIRAAQDALDAHAAESVRAVRDALTVREQRDLADALADPAISDEAISAALLARGITGINPRTVSRHRRTR